MAKQCHRRLTIRHGGDGGRWPFDVISNSGCIRHSTSIIIIIIIIKHSLSQHPYRINTITDITGERRTKISIRS